MLTKFLFKLHGLAFWWWLGSLSLALAAFTPARAASITLPNNVLPAPGLLIQSQQNGGAVLQDLLDSVSSQRLAAGVQRISNYSRCLTDPGHAEAGRYIQNELKTLGYNPALQTFSVSLARGAQTYNIAARLPGANPERTHLVIGHWDSSPVQMFPPVCNSLAPGANDNGTGTAALLEMARLLSNGRTAFQDDILLVWMDAEEFGYLGSQYFVQNWDSDRNLNPDSLPLGAVINLDMIGFSGSKGRSELWAVAEGAASIALAQSGVALAGSRLPEIKFGLYTIGDKYASGRDPNRNSDQRAFWEAGKGTAIFITEDVAGGAGFDPRWHNPGDRLYEDARLRLNPVQMADATRLALLITANQAGIKPGRFFKELPLSFEQNWSKADRPVKIFSEGGASVGRSWLWGPQPAQIRTELYSNSPGGSRTVAYFDKARMELTGSAGGVTNGLLVTEMATGQLQLGDQNFRYVGPSAVQVAGDSNGQGQNGSAPTYASFKKLVEGPPTTDRSGQTLTASLSKVGQVAQDSALAGKAYNRFYVPETGHNIADVFWNYFGAVGRTYDPANDSYRAGLVFDWFSTVGLPLTEAYWIPTEVNGVNQAVLVQLFQRRVLTYTLSNEPQWQVEMGNVGQHYAAWRY